MKKIGMITMGILLIFALVGCSEQSNKIEYIKSMLESTPKLIQAYAELTDLYTSPLGYSPQEWTTQFRESKSKIENEYDKISKLTPLESLTDTHNKILATLESTIEANNFVDNQIKKGENIDYQKYVAKFNQFTSTISESLDKIKSMGDSTTES